MKKLTLTKWGFLLLIIIFVGVHLHSPLLSMRVGVEILFILSLSQLLGKQFPNKIAFWIKYVLSSFLLLFSLVNAIIYAFSGTYLTVLMTSNLTNIGDLGGNLVLYSTAAIFVLFAAFLPMRYDLFTIKAQGIFLAFTGLYFISLNATVLTTPLFGYVSYFQSLHRLNSINIVNTSSNTKNKIQGKFAHTSIASGITTYLDKPNVIVIFTEGLSQEVLNYDKGKLTPNLNKLKKQTLCFSNYYNQTAATFRAVRGQLMSGQQLNQGYENGVNQIKQNLTTKMTSLQSILGNNGYQTTFINAEPNQNVWTTYVDNLGFDKVTTGKSSSFINLAGSTFMGDQQNYKELYKQATALNAKNQPFFLADYTFQTHLSLDSNLKYGNGKNSDLNKFHNMDNAFGKFWKKFKKSKLSKNTIVVFTADHASYPDQLYQNTFKTKRSYFVSTVPLMLYVPNQSPRKINAKNRNSLSLAPTVLDLVGIEKANNYFLGTSLFTNNPTKFEYLSTVPPVNYSTKELT